MDKSSHIAKAIAVPGSNHRVVLFRWGLDDTPRLQNVARVDADGRVIWRIELPGQAPHDCFVALRRSGDLLHARTYSGLETCFDFDGRPPRKLAA